MTRRWCAILLAVLVACGSLAVIADEPPADPGDAPLRLNKKNRKADPQKAAPDAVAKKTDAKKPEGKKANDAKDESKEAAAPAPPEVDEKEVMERLARNVRSLDERLTKGEWNEGTRQLQEDILKDIESLIRLSENPNESGGAGQQDQNQGESNQSDNGDQGSQDKNQGKPGSNQNGNGESQAKPGGPSGPGQGQNTGERRVGRGQRPDKGRQRGQLARGKGHQRPGASGRQAGPGSNQPGSEMAGGKEPGGGGGNDKNRAEEGSNADLNKQDVWGHLPESVRATMNAYAGRQEFMAKHEALIKKYYSTIATEGRRKGDQP